MNHESKDIAIKHQFIKSDNELLSRKQLEINAKNRFGKKYRKDITNQYYNKVLIELIFNRKTHMVALFKEYMISDYIDEFLKREYKLKESKERIPKFSHYYQNYSTFFGMPTFSDFEANEIIKDYGERKAEFYYNQHYKMINDDEFNNSDSNSSIKERDKSNNKMINQTIFNSKIKNNIDNATMFTNKTTESNVISSNITIQRILNSTNRSKVLNESSITMNPDEIILSTLNNNVVSNEGSLIDYIKLFNRHQNTKAKQINRRIQVKKFCPFPPSSVLTKRRNTTNKDSLGNGTNSDSNNLISNQSISQLKNIISASNLYFSNNKNKKQQLNKTPLNNNNMKSTISNNSNASNQNLNSNVIKKSLSVKKTRSRNVKQGDIGYKTDEIKRQNKHNNLFTKTQKIDSIIRKYTINYSTKKLTSSVQKKGNSSSQIKLNLKNQPFVARQLTNKSVFKLNQNLFKGKSTNNFNSTNDKISSKSKHKKHQSKQSADDLMKMALTLLMDNKAIKPNANTNSNPHVNININNQININTNYSLPDTINNKLAKNESVAMNINSNLNNLFKSRNKAATNGLLSSKDDDRTIVTSTKGRIFSSYCLGEKKQKRNTQKNDTPNTFNRPISNDLLMKKNHHHAQYQQHQIQSYLCKDTTSKPRPKITYSSSNRLFQTMNQPLIVNTYTKSINSFKYQKPFN